MDKFFNEDALKAGTEAFEKGYAQFTAMTKDQLEKMFPGGAKNFDEVVAFQKQNVDAVVAAGKAATSAWQTMGKQIAEFNQAAVETGLANAKALMSCKTVQEAVELQTEQARKGFDQALAQGTKLGEVAVKATNEAFAPINEQVSKAATKASKAAA